MKAVICLFVLTASVFALTVAPSTTYSSQSGPGNYSGSGVTSSMITAFTNFANSASAYYGNDVDANIRYIKSEMDAQFGTSTLNFFVVIVTGQDKYSWLTRITSENIIACLGGINRVNSDWSYLFIRFIAPAQGSGYVFISQGKAGSGITASIRNVITNAVNTIESGDHCSCDVYETFDIGTEVSTETEVKWSVFCDIAGAVNAYVNTAGGKWISIKPKNCWYTFYASS